MKPFRSTKRLARHYFLIACTTIRAVPRVTGFHHPRYVGNIPYLHEGSQFGCDSMWLRVTFLIPPAIRNALAQFIRPLTRAAFVFRNQIKAGIPPPLISQVCRRLKPDWQKACYRMAVARLALGRYEDAALAAWEVSQGGILVSSDRRSRTSIYGSTIM